MRMTTDQLPSLEVSGRAVSTPYGLLGRDENALSLALGHTFQQCPQLLGWFLKEIGVNGVRRSSLRNLEIHLQRHRSDEVGQGITDIELHLPGQFHVIVEAKVGMGIPNLAQCCKYLPRFEKTGEPIQRLVALVQSANESFVQQHIACDDRLSGRLLNFSWAKFLPRCVRMLMNPGLPSETRNWVRAFYDFLNQEYRMKAFTTEVWIPAINSTKPLWANGPSFWDLHQRYGLYFDDMHPTVRPLYMAFRVRGQVSAIRRVNRIEHVTSMLEVIPDLKHSGKPWIHKPHTVWHLDRAVELPNTLRSGAGMYNRRVRCDLDLLLSCSSVQEVEVKMKERRKSLNEAELG